MILPSAAELFAALDATWPAKSRRSLAGFTLRDGAGGGSRVSAASLDRPLAPGEIAAALPRIVAAERAMGQPPLVMVRDGEQDLDDALAAKGMALAESVIFYTAALADLSDLPADNGTETHWPPRPETRAVWAKGDIGPARQAVMDRAPGPKAAILGRVDGQPAGAGFVVLSERDQAGKIAMLHALVTLPTFRRRGLGRSMSNAAIRFARQAGAEIFALVVTSENPGAIALYESLGMRPAGEYHYRRGKT